MPVWGLMYAAVISDETVFGLEIDK